LKNRTGLRGFIKWIPGLIISILAIIIITKFVDIKEFQNAFMRFNLLDVVIFIVLMILSLLIRAKAWQSLLDVLDFKLSFLVINQGYLFNNLIPRSGEIVRAVLVSNEKKISGFRVLSSIIVERSIDLAIAAGMFLASLPLILEFEWIKPLATALFFGVLLFMIVIIILSHNQTRVNALIINIKGKNKIFAKFVGPAVESLLSGFSTLKNPVKFLVSLFWMVLTWIAWTVLLFYALTLIHPSPPFLWAIFIESVLALGIALPSAPANIGVYEGTMVAALSIFDIDINTALSTAIVLHSIQIFITSIFGVIGLLSQGQSIHKLLEKIKIRSFSGNNEE